MAEKNIYMSACLAILNHLSSIGMLSEDKVESERVEQEKQTFHQLVNVIDKIAVDNQSSVEVAQAIKYAMVATIDEFLMTNSIIAKSWVERPMQLEYFGENSAGEGFFIRLQQLMQQPLVMVMALEIYYLCLQFGFEGKYRVQGREKLSSLVEQLHSQIDSINVKKSTSLLLHAGAGLKKVETVSREIPFWVIGSVTAAAMLTTSVSFSLLMNHKSQAILNEIISVGHQVGGWMF